LYIFTNSKYVDYFRYLAKFGIAQNFFAPSTIIEENMAKRRSKKRTHVKKTENPADPQIPKSFVIRTGKTTADPTSSVLAQLVLDVRRVMEPNTASRLRVPRPSNGHLHMAAVDSRNGIQTD